MGMPFSLALPSVSALGASCSVHSRMPPRFQPQVLSDSPMKYIFSSTLKVIQGLHDRTPAEVVQKLVYWFDYAFTRVTPLAPACPMIRKVTL